MPIMDGFTSATCIRNSESQIGKERVKIIAISANLLENDRKHTTEVGMDDYLPKPIKLTTLQKILEDTNLKSPLEVKEKDKNV